MTVLMTGGTGFVGQRLVRHLLADGMSVAVLTRSESLPQARPSLEGLSYVPYSLTEESISRAVAEAHPDVVVHLAACFVAEHRPADVRRLIDANVLLGGMLLEAMAAAGSKRLVVAGTSWQHADGDHFSPANLYAATKQALEDMAQYYSRSHGFAVVSLCLYDTYGPNDPRGKLISTLVDAAAANRHVALSPGYQKVNLVHVSDAATAFVRAITLVGSTRSAGRLQQFAVRSRDTVTLRDLVRLFEEVRRCRLDIGWGERPYRAMEVMTPWRGRNLLPGWSPKVRLGEGLREL